MLHAPERWSYLVKRINSQLINLPINPWLTENCRCISINYDCSLLICLLLPIFSKVHDVLMTTGEMAHNSVKFIVSFHQSLRSIFSPNLFSTIQYVDMILMSIFLIDINKTVFYHQGYFMIILRDCVFFY